MTLQEFSTLFKSDPVGERIVTCIKEEILNQNKKKTTTSKSCINYDNMELNKKE